MRERTHRGMRVGLQHSRRRPAGASTVDPLPTRPSDTHLPVTVVHQSAHRRSGPPPVDPETATTAPAVSTRRVSRSASMRWKAGPGDRTATSTHPKPSAGTLAACARPEARRCGTDSPPPSATERPPGCASSSRGPVGPRSHRRPSPRWSSAAPGPRPRGSGARGEGPRQGGGARRAPGRHPARRAPARRRGPRHRRASQRRPPAVARGAASG